MLDDNKRCLKLTDYNFSESNLKSKLKSHLDRSVYPRSSESISYIVFNQSEENYWTISLGNYGYELIIHKSKTKGDYIVWPNGEYSKTSYYGTFRDKKAYLIFFDALLKIKNPTKDIKRQIKYMQYSYPELKQLVESSQIEGEIVGDNKNKSEVKSLPPKTKTDEDQPTK
ncbi:hypothetical protein LNTAR_12111 [Lentisphaera araneosa HTCC2155]|uniref:Uncharacterized protein n=2 Tax=Lentisphaera TaxID=256846 RepID=A6DJM3_9BACT|nr:hypothetical protein LNTAR_12111 [Lentisphaera araneosa HTCC2155]